MSAKPFSSVWTRERRGGREQGLSRDQIVRAAVELLDAEGLDALSMRKLGARLGAGATSLYWHVANKDELIELVMDEVYATVVLPEAADWREATRVFAYGMRHAVFEHPWSASLIGVVPALGPNALTASDRLMGAFVRAGFEGIDVDYAMTAVVSYTLGATIPEVAFLSSLKATGKSMTELQAAVDPILMKMAADRPNLLERYRSYANEGFDPLVARRLAFEFGLTALLNGLGARLR
ncbi:TetR/AcrR family transcriptional regulator C-terminal domain-containing protein [Microbispora bryophytorum]|uniref:TetR family transcriptional regulator n=1 Tax=Microbispora bryophytorum TaxID=1460882 RepID=A0A8H9H5Y4_9ACTN|nr:TetR/AcrR family transcriptional regulator C-terminal domain-containing protein [Microbispora bryophytorum]MBD3141305.1 TetR/AcrR family transcriptional regulator C-terminal domain-containing protein [Microbispora bryophytorum]TQR99162.1 TetR family transcriptional regulator [Microbispora bryophytorum]GGO31964.1 TetR family transcriptional regulator [Microbispora bryophytorum]